MQPKELLTIGIVAVGGIAVLVYVASQQTTSTSTAVDRNAAATEQAIIGANTTAQNTQASESLGLAQLAVQAQGLADSENVALALAANQGATQVQLAGMAANATYQSALLDTVAKLESTLSTAQTSQYASYVTGQTALASDAATTSQVGLQTAAAQAIAGIAGNTQVDVASIQGATEQNVSQTQANEATTISNNQTTASVNAANQAASAAKSNGFWNALGSIGGAVAKIFAPSAAVAAPSSGGYTYGYSGLGANVVGGNSAPLG